MKSITVNSPETMKQYQADCRADRNRAKAMIPTLLPEFKFLHDTEFVGKTICVPPPLVGRELSKSDLRLLMV